MKMKVMRKKRKRLNQNNHDIICTLITLQMQNFLQKVKEKAKENPQKIVFPEGDEKRILKAVEIIVKEGIAKPILVGNGDAIKAKATKIGVNLDGIEIIDPSTSKLTKKYAKEFFELRKHKGVSEEQALKQVKDMNYFGTMMVQMDDADGMVSGTIHPTGDTIRPALQIIKTKEKFHKVSGVFFMMLEDKLLLFADSAVTIAPNSRELAEIAIDTAQTAKNFGIQPSIAMLSFSTNGSAKHPLVDKVAEATAIVKHQAPELIIEGEMQVDAALVSEICERKFPGSKIAGNANIMIFPDLQSGNIAYKLVERLANAKAVGPILQGLNKPVNDLSRGCSVNDIVDVTAITVCEAQAIDYAEMLKNTNA